MHCYADWRHIMDIRNTRALKSLAKQRLIDAQDPKRITFLYAAILICASLLVTVASYLLDLQLSEAGGLGGLGTRSLLSTLQTILPFALSLLTMCLNLGYIAAMLRISRKQYTSPQTLRAGYERFWPLLRCMLLQSAIYFAIAFAATYIGSMVFLITPLSNKALSILLPIATEAAESTPTILSGASPNYLMEMDDATYNQLMEAMTPALIISGILFLILAAPFFYRYRMAKYVLLDQPGCGAFAALRESRRMTKGQCFKIVKLDLSFWWYYLLLLVAYVVCDADRILMTLGIPLPMNAVFAYFLFYLIYLGMLFGIYYFLRNRVEVTYALVYDSIRPKQQPQNGVVLGNIFQM